MAATTRFRYPITSRSDLHALVAAVAPDVHRYALLLSGGEASGAERLTVATFGWLARQVRTGRETVTPGRLRLAARRLAAPRAPGRGRERQRWLADTLVRARRLADGPPPMGLTLLEAMPVLERYAFVVRSVDDLPEPDVAAVVHLPEPLTVELLALALRAWSEAGGAERSGRADFERLALPDPPPGLSGRIWSWIESELDPGVPVATPHDPRRPAPLGPIEWLEV